MQNFAILGTINGNDLEADSAATPRRRITPLIGMLLVCLVTVPVISTRAVLWFTASSDERRTLELAVDVVSVILGLGIALAVRAARHQIETAEDQQRVIQARRQWNLTFDAVPDSVFVLDDDSRILRANQATVKLLGIPQHEVVGRKCYEVVHGRTDPIPGCPRAAALKTGRVAEGCIEETRLGRTYNVTATPLKHDDHSAPAGCVHVLHDLTEQRQNEAELRRQALILECMHDAVVVVNVDEHISDWNPAATRLFGYQKCEIIGKPVQILHPRESAEVLDASIRSALQSNRAIDIEVPFNRKDGSQGIGRLTVAPFRDPSGRLMGSIGVIRDIGERKRAEHLLRRSETKYRELFDNAPCGICLCTTDGRFLDINQSLVKMLGYQGKDSLLELSLSSVSAEASICDTIVRSLTDSDAGVSEVNLKRQDGTLLHARLSGRVISTANSSPLSCLELMVEDVTEQRKLQHQLLQAQKMESIGRLSGGIAHDFNNVIMAMNGYAELIMGCGSCDSQIKHYAERIFESGKRAGSLTQQLLAFSRNQILKPRVLDLHEVVVSVCSMLRPMLGDDIELVFTSDPNVSRVHADGSQIEQVLMNLVVNARDAMPSGGKLHIELQDVLIDRDYSQRHPQVAPGNYVLIVVSDTGLGMDANTQAHIFEPFFTTKPVGKGTGLGLSTVYGIVKQSGGFVWVYSEPGVGTTFKIYFPATKAKATAAYAPNIEVPSTRVVGGTILLVDDDKEVRSAAGDFLRTRGYHVLEAASGPEAVEICKAQLGHVDVMLTDLIMPGMKGSQLASEVAAIAPDVRILYMSGYTERSDEVHALGRSVAFLQKPFSLKAMENKIRLLLSPSSSHGESVAIPSK